MRRMRSEQRVLSVSETVRRPISDYGVLARLSDHRGRVRIVPQEIVRDRVLLASGSVTIRASVRATVVHADVDAFDTAAGFSLVPVFGGGDAVAGDPLDQVFVDTRPPGMPGLAQIDLDCACFQPDRAVRDRRIGTRRPSIRSRRVPADGCPAGPGPDGYGGSGR